MKKMHTLYYTSENTYKNRLMVALKTARICVFEVDLTRQLYTFFENAEDIFGISGEEILAEVQPYSALSPEEYQKAVISYFSHPEDGAGFEAMWQVILIPLVRRFPYLIMRYTSSNMTRKHLLRKGINRRL